MTEFPPITILYTNWRDETAWRHVRPIRFYFGTTPHHPEPCHLLHALDLEEGKERTFALKAVKEWKEGIQP